jgi:hypothetical protein
MKIRKGAAYTAIFKQKLNPKIVAEADLVAHDDAMTQAIYTRHFLAAQKLYVLHK